MPLHIHQIGMNRKNVGQHTEQQELSYPTGGNVNEYIHYRIAWLNLQKKKLIHLLTQQSHL